jgi:hypothetical protein
MTTSSRIKIVIGAYGSGKTEFALNYALWLKNQVNNVGLVDLDIVNPYFRSRDLREQFESQGIPIISSHTGLENADIPALSPRIFSLLEAQQTKVVFDVGGDPAGARALGRFQTHIQREKYDLWMVVNPFRPETGDTENVLEMISRLEAASRLKITGLIDNTNMGKQTTSSDREWGRNLISIIAERGHLPIVWRTLSPDCPNEENDEIPLLPIHLYLRPAWLG